MYSVAPGGTGSHGTLTVSSESPGTPLGEKTIHAAELEATESVQIHTMGHRGHGEDVSISVQWRVGIWDMGRTWEHVSVFCYDLLNFKNL